MPGLKKGKKDKVEVDLEREEARAVGEAQVGASKKCDLFGDDDEEESELQLNEEKWKEIEQKKRDNEAQRLKALYGELEEDSSEGTEEDEDAVLLSSDRDLRILEALTALKRGDKEAAAQNITAVNAEVKDHLSSILTGKESIADQEKKLTLRDYMRTTLLAKGAAGAATLEEDEERDYARRAPQATEAEEDEAKRAFKDAFQDAEDGFVIEKSKEKSAKAKAEEDAAVVPVSTLTAEEKERRVTEQLESLFQDVDPKDEREMFLKSFFLNEGWQRETSSVVRDQDVAQEIEQEQEQDDFEEQQKNFEEHYEKTKYHHEEEGATDIASHPRAHMIDNSLRREVNPRKEARERKKQREQEAKVKLDEEVKRLKFLKRKEMDDKMKKIEVVAGTAPEELADLADSDEEFDPDTWDKKMSKIFNEDYYDAANDSFDPSDIDDDEDLALSSGSDDSSDSDDAPTRKPAAKQAKAPKKKAKSDPATDLTEEEKKELQKKKRLMLKQLEEEVERDMDEYAKLDYQDVVAGKKVRFKYASVPKETFGFTDDDVFELDDRRLNMVAPLKFYAPYRSAHENRKARQAAIRNKGMVDLDPEKEVQGSNKFPKREKVEIVLNKDYKGDEGDAGQKEKGQEEGKKRKREAADVAPQAEAKKGRKSKKKAREAQAEPTPSAPAGEKKAKKKRDHSASAEPRAEKKQKKEKKEKVKKEKAA
eukprot:TRINITY_DN9168_c0_g1_i1.p1 TRINITY_DN9168_c0_g1~~TRINITY_DN9168_c0_g1_i1.p1  ORF type:complete len:707 (+),score=334.90 TRINITY_DN9168_c0_g1_i1:105-2225(+)